MDYAEFLKKMKKDKRSLANTEVCGCRGDPCRFPNVLMILGSCNPVVPTKATMWRSTKAAETKALHRQRGSRRWIALVHF